VLGALAAAHRAGIVHRDVKPNNVMVLDDGRAKLADFGIATVRDDPSITATGMVLGTPKYMSPEQARGETAGAPADLWGLGALLYFAVEGVAPFDRGDTLPTLHAVLHDEPRPLQRGRGLAPVIGALLTKDPAARPSIDDTRRLLQGIAAGAPRTMVLPTVQERTPVAPPPRATSPGNRRWLLALAAVAAVALVAAAALALTYNGDKGVAAAPTTTTTSAPPSTTTTTASTTTTTAPAAVERPPGVPSDWAAYQGDGWQVWHPADWSPKAGPAGSVDISSPAGDYLRIDTVNEPLDDPKAAWESQEQSFAANHPDYQRIRIDDADFQGMDAAIWEFTFDGRHAADLGFSDGNRGYALNLVAGEDRWDALADTWQAFQDSFSTN
jgi:serine/threonine protein kinase